MNYIFSFYTDVGIKKSTNQDSCCVLEAETGKGKLLFAVLCDGMGGLEKGEVASATIINAFSNWFENSLSNDLGTDNPLEEIKYEWDRMIKELNQKIAEYGRNNHIQLGSTITSLLVLEDGNYIIGHVGDSRAYKITNSEVSVLTEDQTLVAREVKMGRMTPEEAKKDSRRNVLLQCIGASKIVEPAFYFGQVSIGDCYMLCSDGFRHVITEDEIINSFSPAVNADEGTMKEHIKQLIELNKERGETDNITSILIKVI